MDFGMIARVMNHWLGGTYRSTKADLDFAQQVELVAPHIPYLVRAQRAMLGRMVRYLVSQGIRQFLDLGSGVPTRGNVHEVARGAAPDSRVVYVDREPEIAADGRDLVAGDDQVAYLCVDFRCPADVLDAPETRRLIDFGRPVALLFIESLTLLPDTDDPYGLVAAYSDALTSGSYVGVSQANSTRALESALALSQRMFNLAPPSVFLRDRERQAEFFTGLELVEPGITPVQLWKPEPGTKIDHNAELGGMFVGLGRKP
ncbi:SAM-dependent methyltransferase [Amycolatopsis pigmentata]|uniref:SAM-dependent methyltransferase n=1 Tax=Amycolatopsis pigmentata TaxID=450801 RepID=A0ABW5FPE0_9PSEU